MMKTFTLHSETDISSVHRFDFVFNKGTATFYRRRTHSPVKIYTLVRITAKSSRVYI